MSCTLDDLRLNVQTSFKVNADGTPAEQVDQTSPRLSCIGCGKAFGEAEQGLDHLTEAVAEAPEPTFPEVDEDSAAQAE